MNRRLDLDQLLARNKQISPDRLEEARELARRLHEQGVQRKGYDLALPFGGHRVSVRDDVRNEPRLSHLGQLRDAE